LRRIIILGTAIAVLAVAGGVAYGATFNSYSAKLTFSPSKAGSAKKPSPLGFTEALGANPLNGNLRAAPLVDIKTTMYGVVSNAKYFPTCSARKIESNPLKWDKACPSKSLVATGPVTSLLGPATSLKVAGSPCNPFLHIYNGGKGKLVFFFVVIPGHSCGTLQTGASAPYIGHIKEVGKNMVTDVPLPPDVSTKAGNLAGVYGSLIHEKLTFRKLTTKVKGKTVGYQSSVACKGGKRPWSVQFTSVNQGVKETPQTVKGTSKC
jgi:hypothetical protein